MVSSSHVLDPISTAEVTVVVTLDSHLDVTGEVTFQVGLVCSEGQQCLTQDQLDALPDTSPVMDTTSGLTGLVQSNPLEDTWFVSKAYYVLCKVKLYKDVRSASGFEVTFCPHPREQFPGLPEETHLFGQTTHVKNVEEITLDSDLKRVEICVDNVHAQGGAGADFEGFKFTEMDG